MPNIGIIASHDTEFLSYAQRLEHRATSWSLLLDRDLDSSLDLTKIHGVVVIGSNHRVFGSNKTSHRSTDLIHGTLGEKINAFIKDAMARDIPILGIDRGLQVLNVASGGSQAVAISDHSDEGLDGKDVVRFHRIWISPGSKFAAVIGSGGIVRVNSSHVEGIREAHKARNLIASAYCLDDGVIEGLESPNHTWVVAVQCHPERIKEVPRQFSGLFEALVHYATKRQDTLGH